MTENNKMPKLTDIEVLRRAELIMRNRVEDASAIINTDALESPDATREALKLKFAQLDSAREHFLIVHLNNRHKVIDIEVHSTGTIDCASVYPRDVFRSALTKNSAALIFAHNHPSGEPKPSATDHRLTRKLCEGAALFDIRVLDHIIMCASGESHSFAEHGEL